MKDSLKGMYVATALWAEDIPLAINEVPKNVYAKANKDCLVFYTKLVSKVGGKVAEQIISIEGGDTLSHAGHDFYLTRNGHGTGFWDRDEDFYFGHNELLTELSEQMKSDEFVILGLEFSEEGN